MDTIRFKFVPNNFGGSHTSAPTVDSAQVVWGVILGISIGALIRGTHGAAETILHEII